VPDNLAAEITADNGGDGVRVDAVAYEKMDRAGGWAATLAGAFECGVEPGDRRG